MTITVIGATGNVGTLVARGLLAEGQRVRALVRDPGKARDRLGPDSRLEIITGDLGTPADLEAVFRGADAAYVALGSIGLEGNLARLADVLRHALVVGVDVGQREHRDLDPLELGEDPAPVPAAAGVDQDVLGEVDVDRGRRHLLQPPDPRGEVLHRAPRT